MDDGTRSNGKLLWDTDLVTACGDDFTNDTPNVLTPVVRAVQVKEVLPDVWIGCKSKCKVRIGVGFSDNPIDFTAGIRKELFATYLTTPGWNYGSTYYDIWNLSGFTNPDYHLYVRFLALVLTTSSSTAYESMQLRVRFFGKPIVPQTIVSPWTMITSKA